MSLQRSCIQSFNYLLQFIISISWCKEYHHICFFWYTERSYSTEVPLYDYRQIFPFLLLLKFWTRNWCLKCPVSSPVRIANLPYMQTKFNPAGQLNNDHLNAAIGHFSPWSGYSVPISSWSPHFWSTQKLIRTNLNMRIRTVSATFPHLRSWWLLTPSALGRIFVLLIIQRFYKV